MKTAETKKNVNRIDGLDPARWMTTPFKKTDEGFLQGRPIVTSVGVFSYRNADGSITRELRLPEEVFDKDSLESMKGKPVSNDHPEERVTSENVKAYQVGSLGSNPSDWVDGWAASHKDPEPLGRGMPGSDGFHIAIDMTITDEKAIADVLAGKTALSMGYFCDIEPAQPGAVWCGMSYDGIQRKIRYNHCAIVDAARAGDAARIRMDSADAIQILNTDTVGPKSNQEGFSMMKKIRLDGVDYEGEEGLIKAYQDQKKRADDAEAVIEKIEEDLEKLKKEVSKLEGEAEDKKDRAAKLEAELKLAKDQAMDPKRLDALVKARVDLLDAAILAGVEVRDGVSDADLQKSIITTVYPEAKLDGKDEAYINGRFDSALEDLRKDADDRGRPIVSDSLASGSRSDSASARQKMMDYQRALSRGQKVEG